MAEPVGFVGRRADLGALRSAWHDASAGMPTVMVLRGAPGIGKTTLLNEFVRSATGATVLRGTAQADSAIPYLAVATALRPLWDDESPFERLALTRPEGISVTPSSLEIRLDLVLKAVSALIERARETPVLFVVDDAHWADSASVELLSHLLQSLGGAGVDAALLVVLAMRPLGGDSPAARLVERAARDPLTRMRDVEGLDLVAVNDLVVEFKGRRPSKPFLRSLHESSGGNPLFIRSLLDRLEAFGGIAVRGSMLVQTSTAEPLASPRDLDQLLRDRLAHVGDVCRRLLVIAAFLAEEGTLETLELLSGLEGNRFEQALEEARDARLLDDDGETFRFDHPQLRQVLYQTPRGKRRSELHLRIADHLEGQGDMEKPTTAIAVARHLRRAGDSVDPHRLLGSALRAGRAAEDLGAWADAADAYDTALAVSEGETGAFRALIATRAARAHWWNMDNERAFDLANEALEPAKLSDDLDLWATALELRSRAIWSGPDTARSRKPDLAPYEDFLNAAGARRDDLRARVHWMMTALGGNVIDLETARKHLAEAEKLANADDDALRARLSASRGLVSLLSGDPSAAAVAYAEAADAADRDGDTLRGASVRARQALAHWMTGELDVAESLAERAATSAAEVGAWAEAGLALGIAACIANCSGDPRALDLAHEAARITRWTEFGQAAPFAFSALARAAAERGQFREAHAALDWLAEMKSPAAVLLRPAVFAVEGAKDAAISGLAAVRQLTRDIGVVTGSAVQVFVANAFREAGEADARAAVSALVDLGIRYETSWGFDLTALTAAPTGPTG